MWHEASSFITESSSVVSSGFGAGVLVKDYCTPRKRSILNLMNATCPGVNSVRQLSPVYAMWL